MKLPPIDMRTFYFFGTILFFVGLIGNAWNMYLSWHIQNIGSRIYGVSNFLFQFLLLAFFYNLWKSTPKPLSQGQQEEINKIIEEYSKNESS